MVRFNNAHDYSNHGQACACPSKRAGCAQLIQVYCGTARPGHNVTGAPLVQGLHLEDQITVSCGVLLSLRSTS